MAPPAVTGAAAAALAVACFAQALTLPSGHFVDRDVAPLPPPLPLPQPPPPRPPPYARFHANDSFLGRLINCSREEKICFGYNTLYYPQEQRCLRREDYDRFVGNRKLFDDGRGHLVAQRLAFRDPCRGLRMAWDGRCYSRGAVRLLCGCEQKLTRHFLGGVECRCESPPPARIEQPEEPGLCRLPDLLRPDYQRLALRGDTSGLLEPLLLLQCSAHQAACFQAGRVAVAGTNGCSPLHSRGPCQKDYVVALDEQPAQQRRAAEGACVHARGRCPRGQRRMAYDGLCHTDEEVEMVRPGQLMHTAFGRHALLGPRGNWFIKLSVATVLEFHYHFRVCVVRHDMANNTATSAAPPDAPCGAGAGDYCSVYKEDDLPPE